MLREEAIAVLESLFTDSTSEEYPFTEEFGEAVRVAVETLRTFTGDCTICKHSKKDPESIPCINCIKNATNYFEQIK